MGRNRNRNEGKRAIETKIRGLDDFRLNSATRSNYHSINNRVLFDVEPKDGYESLRDDLMVRPLTGVQIIGAIVDADTDPHGRWHSLRSGLLDSGYTDFPTAPAEGGTIVPGISGLPSIGI